VASALESAVLRTRQMTGFNDSPSCERSIALAFGNECGPIKHPSPDQRGNRQCGFRRETWPRTFPITRLYVQVELLPVCS